MSEFKSIVPENFDENVFDLVGSEWMLISAQKDEKVNTMTASWGGFGVMWGKKVAFIFVRKSRYTKEFIDNADNFSITFFNHQENIQMLSYMGKVSGRDEDKIANMGLKVNYFEHTPYFDEARAAIICKKLCMQPLEADSFIDSEIDKTFYGDKDYHVMYIGEIIQVLQK